MENSINTRNIVSYSRDVHCSVTQGHGLGLKVNIFGHELNAQSLAIVVWWLQSWP